MIEQETLNGVANPPVDLVALLALLNDEPGWGLSAAMLQRYHDVIVELVPPGSAAALVERIALNYHLDHQLFEALHNQQHDQHDSAWTAWMAQVAAILRGSRIAWERDITLDLDDLAQVARLGLHYALPEYRYASRFSTWAFTVIVRSARNEIRMRLAAKRLAHTVPLDRLASDLALAVPDAERPESAGHMAVLSGLIREVLGEQRDRRFVRIFQLWAYGDKRIADIAKLVGLSDARVRALLTHILDLLRSDPRLRAWADDQETMRAE